MSWANIINERQGLLGIFEVVTLKGREHTFDTRVLSTREPTENFRSRFLLHWNISMEKWPRWKCGRRTSVFCFWRSSPTRPAARGTRKFNTFMSSLPFLTTERMRKIYLGGVCRPCDCRRREPRICHLHRSCPSCSFLAGGRRPGRHRLHPLLSKLLIVWSFRVNVSKKGVYRSTKVKLVYWTFLMDCFCFWLF